ncbi:5-methylphenazine-1-carboxylate 1-monooxygenase [Lachnellula subtilissima]|uniref:5-methylphenazine-1-carboxylate 1-monooxygenase n=1 Tax=Lachnellula subtilissima TaxID=602034 RepID=A0A8H8RKR8_9HELO|nr:5-methylphenazine-1-carboxylate 1-monooxygenase [Lachnellula subtilissima]
MGTINHQLSIAIIGGGIGGLVLALQLEADGFRNITIFEASRSLKAIGSGINLQPSAVLVLRNLGLLPALEDTGIKTSELRYYNRHGHYVVSEKRGEDAGYLVPQFSVHRGMLHELLLKAVQERLGENCVQSDHVFTSYSQDEGGITANFTRRSDPSQPAEIQSRTTDVLVAADGINSTARRLLYPDEGPPNFSGRMLWRGVSLREPFLTGRSMVWAGHADQKFIAYPVGRDAEQEGKSLVNWIAELRVRGKDDPDLTPPVADWGKVVPKSRFASKFDSWTFGFLSIPELIAETAEVSEFPMCDRTPVDRWSFGKITLLGDAAHPLYPIGSNGASQAILDAVALSSALQNEQDVPKALTNYQDARLPTTAKICFANRANGPDHVLQLAHERAPDGFENIDDIIGSLELEDVGRAYKLLAGFDMESVNRKAEETKGLWDTKIKEKGTRK